jgi:hypothetical protein
MSTTDDAPPTTEDKSSVSTEEQEQTENADGSQGQLEKEDNFGLSLYAEETTDSFSNPTLDIVTVHGFYGHYRKTFSTDDDAGWLKDLSKISIPTHQNL